MLNEAPKKPKKIKDYSNPTRWQLFWRIQRECWRRMISPYFMYLFLSTLGLALQAMVPGDNTVLDIVLGSVCIAGGAFFNAHLLYHTGKMHYDAYITGSLHRKNRALGIKSGGDHRVEREYRVWKGFLIGFCVGVPAIFLGIIAGAFPGSGEGVAYFFMVMFVGWAIFPPRWYSATHGNMFVSGYWSLLMVFLPILVSGIAYIVGAAVEKRAKANEAERLAKAEEEAKRREAEQKQARLEREQNKKRNGKGKK